jgi:LPXTG-motif cell wall-anchored protein
MKAFVSLGSLVLALVPALALAQQPAACERVQFSEEVLARFPNIRQACLDVINKDGQDYVVVKAHLVRTTSRRATVRIKRPDGSFSDPINIDVQPNRRFNVGGKMVPLQDVAVGQELTTYIRVKDPGIALASDAEIVEFTPVPATPAPAPAAEVAAAPEMPKTATNLPLAGTIGLILLALGAGIAFMRRRNQA